MNKLGTAQLTSEGKTTTYHVSIAIRLAETLLATAQRDGEPQTLLVDAKDDSSVSYDKAFKVLRSYRKRGWTCIPPCDNIKDNGSCAGHP